MRNSITDAAGERSTCNAIAVAWPKSHNRSRTARTYEISANFVETLFGRRDPSGIAAIVRGARVYHATGNRFMRIKALAVLVLLAVSSVLFIQFRKDNRADAAASNCYSDAKGPSAPTLCN
jgi:hypothetical protein